MAIANVALTDTFDEWRVKTNSLIVQGTQLTVNLASTLSYSQNVNVLATSANTLATTANNRATTAINTATAANTTATSANTSAAAAVVTATAANTTATTANTTATSAIATATSASATATAASSTATAANTTAASAVTTATAANTTATSALSVANGKVPGAVISNNTTSTNTFSILATSITSGNLTTAIVSSTKLYYQPSTGTLSATEVNSLSDANLKTNVVTIDNALEKILSLRGVSFNWKDDNRESVGVIAQEVESVIPVLVKLGNRDTKTVNYDGFAAYLIEAIKELHAELEELKKKL